MRDDCGTLFNGLGLPLQVGERNPARGGTGVEARAKMPCRGAVPVTGGRRGGMCCGAGARAGATCITSRVGNDVVAGAPRTRVDAGRLLRTMSAATCARGGRRVRPGEDVIRAPGP